MIPSLPFEINEYIIQLNLPTLRRSYLSKRNEFLVRISTVSRMWKEIAQSELIKHLYIQNEQRLAIILKELERRSAAGLRIRVVSVKTNSWIDHDNSGSTRSKNLIQLLLLVCKEVEDIWIRRCSLIELSKNFDSIEYLNLKSLHLEEFFYNPDDDFSSSFNFQLPALTHLSLLVVRDRELELLSNVLLKPSVTPSLESLAIISCRASDLPIKLIPLSIAVRLKQVVIHNYFAELGSILDIRSMQILRTLVILNVSHLQSIINIPPTLSNVQICESGTIHYTDDLNGIQEWIASVDTQHQLRQISFPLPTEYYASGTEEARKIDELHRNLFNFLDGRGIALKFTKNFWNAQGEEIFESL